MSFTYSRDPINVPRDAVRLECGDTDAEHPLLEDGEIAYCLAQEPNTLLASARACEIIAAAFAVAVDREVDDMKLKASQRYEHFTAKARALRSRAGRFAGIYAGGISQAEKDSDSQDADLVQPTFYRGQMDNPGTMPNLPGNGGYQRWP